MRIIRDNIRDGEVWYAMHELPAASWLLIVFSTVPWLVLTAIHYVSNSRRNPSAALQRDDS